MPTEPMTPHEVGQEYLRSVKALARAAGQPEAWARAVLATLARGPEGEVWLLVPADFLDRHLPED